MKKGNKIFDLEWKKRKYWLAGYVDGSLFFKILKTPNGNRLMVKEGDTWEIIEDYSSIVLAKDGAINTLNSYLLPHN